MVNECLARAYHRYRREHPEWNARMAIHVARGQQGWQSMGYEVWRNESYRTVERDGLTFYVEVEFDYDAYQEYKAEGETWPQWWCSVSVMTPKGLEHVDSLGGIGGGYWDGREEASLDDETEAYIWDECIDPFCDPEAIRADWVKELL